MFQRMNGQLFLSSFSSHCVQENLFILAFLLFIKLYIISTYPFTNIPLFYC